MAHPGEKRTQLRGLYVYQRLLENPDLDMESTILDWCEAAVGPEAAPHLRAYYAFWETFWRERAVRTRWWRFYDFFWGLHIMDPVEREDSSHLLLWVFSVIALGSSLLGTVLLFRHRRAVKR